MFPNDFNACLRKAASFALCKVRGDCDIVNKYIESGSCGAKSTMADEQGHGESLTQLSIDSYRH